MRRRLHIGWVLAIGCWLLAVSCSSDKSGEKQPTTLTVYVYSPEHPMLIRAAVGDVNPSADESKITQLQIWIFESATGRKVGYLNTSETSLLTTGEGATYQIVVEDDIAQQKPDVDIYILANVKQSNCGCAFGENNTRDQLRDIAKLDESHFGLSSLTTTVPSDGLPMSGVLRNQPVIGDAPVLRIGTQNHISTVSLVRAVSKVRFVFANTEGAPDLKIKDIQLNAGMIPNVEYLIPQTRELAYNATAIPMLASEIDVVTISDPTRYIYDGSEAQAYETLINESELTKTAPYYLHESDKRLTGTITYQIGDDEEQIGTFEMDAAGDFLRNHTWIVYAYHVGGGFLQMNAIYVKDWTTKEEEHEVYNW